MKRKIAILLVVLAAMAPMVNAVIVNVEVGDRPYYVHGPGYYVGRAYWVGFRDIGVGIIITNTGSTAITRPGKRTHLF